ncbi:HU family DNA-binding protein [Enterocloster citroniae]|uniref:DNA-binding protein HU n=1 Tax=[Clostridium] citroniae WAL-17108 TaxID=742733 RepID=G5HER5_9FIRM|nr:HU family DNA-binding protein [Enterocloster citroniae]EHF00024.1 hypothetical protein HMPREF9469_00938 [ [[Clostridium] citroniae WAL-17108]MCC3383282.1 hypothetical protein [Enterocloster citroniae]DAT42492.1 MAG TPA: Bacterial DNA-binding protein [Caudoviricetes sp.]
MSKNDLAKIYVNNGYAGSITEAAEQIDNFINVIGEALSTGKKVTLHGFLSMQVVEKPAQNFTDPITKEKKILAPKKRIRISQTPGFKNIAGR